MLEEPDAVVVDLAGAVVAEPPAALVFAAASRQAPVRPGTPLLVVAPDPALARLLPAGYERVAVVDSVEEALATPPRPRMPSLSDTLLPVSGAARHARDMATEACARWDVPHLIGPAGLIAAELVTTPCRTPRPWPTCGSPGDGATW
ncbi:hypothetical protein AB0J83_34970 [Actinoplanes sp. NPDC049596]|uniref:hypothetical protein n=1 Tax=unclassified Actinoplanes TaxID=2626549 RepID=UPI00342DEF42